MRIKKHKAAFGRFSFIYFLCLTHNAHYAILHLSTQDETKT
jgi:hypothetical protein